MLEEVYSLLESGDSFQAIATIEKSGDSKKIVNTYSELVRDLYSVKHDVPRMIVIGRTGVSYCLTESTRLADEDAELSEKLKGMAKAMSYNISANAWPGWQDEGITITRSDSVAGLDLARFNLRLAGELKRDDVVFTNAHWLVGAHHLALQENDAAIEQFTKAVEYAKSGEKPDFEHMSRGYIGVAKLAADKSSEEGGQLLTEAIAKLKEIGSDDAKFFAGQLESVSKLFTAE